jgi:hypothetical protein
MIFLACVENLRLVVELSYLEGFWFVLRGIFEGYIFA